MIQSSVLIRILLTAVRALENWYKHSVLHKIFAAIGGVLKNQWMGSATRKMLYSGEGLFARSLFFRILRFFYRLFNTIAYWVRIRIAKAVSNSVGFKIVNSYSAWDSAFKISGMVFAGFGLSILTLGLLRRNLWGTFGLVFLLAGLMMNRMAGNLREIIDTSYAIKVFKSLWSLLLYDKEVERWNRV